MLSGFRRGWSMSDAAPPPVGGWLHSCGTSTDPWSVHSRWGSIARQCCGRSRLMHLPGGWAQS
eukprot:356725-Alexandrium_andersonii.AAC.1